MPVRYGPTFWLDASRSVLSTPNPIGSISAVAAVLLIHIEMTAVAAPTASRIREGRAPTHERERIPVATRRSTPCTAMASAKRKLPMKRKMMGCPKDAKMLFADPSPATAQAAAPSSDVTGSGIGSRIQYRITQLRIAASACASAVRAGIGIRNRNRAAAGPAAKAVTCPCVLQRTGSSPVMSVSGIPSGDIVERSGVAGPDY